MRTRQKTNRAHGDPTHIHSPLQANVVRMQYGNPLSVYKPRITYGLRGLMLIVGMMNRIRLRDAERV